jgi:hypothetical protein
MIQVAVTEKPKGYDERYLSKFVGTRSEVSAPRIACDDIMAGAIALLSDQEIASMNRDDLLDIVRAGGGVQHSPVKTDQIDGFDDDRLRRVLFHVRRWMRTRVNEQSREKGWTPFFRDRF